MICYVFNFSKNYVPTISLALSLEINTQIGTQEKRATEDVGLT